jgi:anion-transporting  ArsA/GET3 family ATPase
VAGRFARDVGCYVSIDDVLEGRHIVICTGPGGVGKTTTAAALALRAAEAGRHTVVCTIDPARRLAQSLGLDELGNEPRRVGVGRKGGRLDAMMLDMKRTFDEMILELATEERAEKIFSNPFYKHISSTLSGSQEYAAMEKLYELHQEGRWQLIIIDTPPTRSALDFLDAPRRITDFFEGRFLKLLLWPYVQATRGYFKALGFGARAALRTVTKITGSELFADVANFFAAFEGMYGTFKSRAAQVRELLGARRTSFVVVSSPQRASLDEARFFVERLRQEKMPLGGVVVNRTHHVEPAAGLEDPKALGASISGNNGDVRMLAQALQVYGSWREVSVREDELITSTLGQLGRVPVWRVPDYADDVHDVPALRRLGEALARSTTL